jgi:zinc protease
MTDAFQSNAEAERLRRTIFAEGARRFTLKNGLTVLHREDFSAELVSVQLWLKTGSMHEGVHMGAGISHYLEHMVFKGTERRGDGQIAREVQERGGSINAYTTFDRTVYYVDLPAENGAFGLDLLSDMVFAPKLAVEDAVKEREVILREIDMGKDDPDHRVSRSLFETAFRSHPYRHPVIGYRDLFCALKPEDLRAYHAARYHPGNAVLVVVGAMDEAQLAEGLKAHYEELKPCPLSPVAVPVEPAQLAQRSQRLSGDVSVCRGVMAFSIPGLAHVDSPVLDMLASGLGHGHSAHLWCTLRDEAQLVHDVSVHSWNPGDRGLFWVSYFCDPGKRERVEKAILNELERVKEKGLPISALEKARRSALVGEINTRKTMSGQASRLGMAEVVVGEIGYPESYHERLEKVTMKELQAVARRYFRVDQLTSVSLNQKQAEDRTFAPARDRQRPADFELRRLSNGALLVWQEDHRLPKVNMRFGALGGAHYETAEERGITSLLSTMLTKDTRWGRASEVAEAIESVGGYFNEFSGNNAFGLSLEVLSQDLPLGRSLLQDAILAPRFEPEVFERERDALIAGIKERWDDNVERAHTLLRKRFFGDHPLGIDPEGTVETLQALHLDALRAHRDRLLLGGNAVLTIAGDFDPDRELPLLEAFLLDLPSWSFEPEDVPFEPPQAIAIEEFVPREQAVVMLGFPDAGVKGDTDLCGQLMHAACADMASTLFTKVREEKNLAYFVSAGRLLSLHCGQFTFYGGTHPDSAAEVLAAFQEEAERLRTVGLEADELERARMRLKGQTRISRQSLNTRANHACLNALYGLPVNDWRDFDERLDRLTVEDLRAYAARYLDPAHGVSLILGPSAVV